MNRTVISWISILLIGLYFGIRFLLQGPSDEAVHRSYTQAVGIGIGQLLARDLPAGGRVLYLVPGADEEVIRAQFQPHAEGMQAGFAKPGLDVVIAIGEGDQAPRRSLDEMVGIVPQTLADLEGAVARATGITAIVASITPVGLPDAVLLRRLPPLYVIDLSADPRWAGLLRSGTVKGVVVRNPEADLLPMSEALQSPEEVFALRYRLVAPE